MDTMTGTRIALVLAVAMMLVGCGKRVATSAAAGESTNGKQTDAGSIRPGVCEPECVSFPRLSAEEIERVWMTHGTLSARISLDPRDFVSKDQSWDCETVLRYNSCLSAQTVREILARFARSDPFACWGGGRWPLVAIGCLWNPAV
jgi:hypothetical protein